MLLKNKVALYGLAHDRRLTYKEYVDKINWKHWLFVCVVYNNGDIIYIRVPDGAWSMRDFDMFALGLENSGKCKVERCNYEC